MAFISRELDKIKQRGLYRELRTVDGAQGPKVKIDGREVLLLCSNDYLGLANDGRVKKAAIGATETYGAGSGASRLVSGSMRLHHRLEEEIASFLGMEKALLFNSGYCANSGVIPALFDRNDIIFSDRLNHASIVDGCLLSRAVVRRYHHTDMAHLSELMEQSRDGAQHKTRRLIVTDGVFSMDGDIAPLERILSISRKEGAMVMVDDAHGFGVLGENGRGTLEQLGIDAGGVDIHMGTLGKALGSFGAFVAGKRELIELLINRARPFIYSTALPPSVAAAALAALEIVESEPERRELLRENADFMRDGLNALGYDTMGSETHIIPLLIGNPDGAISMMEALLEEGVYAQAIRPPTVPEGMARVRVTLSAAHEKKDLEKALRSFERAGHKAGIL